MRVRTVELLPANTTADLWAIAGGWIAPSMGDAKLMKAFEMAFAHRMGGGHASTFSAGRIALAAILEALDIGDDDEVIVPGYTCVAVPNPVLFRGAKPVYADINPSTLNISVETVTQVITSRTRAIVAQHTFGLPAPMRELAEFAKARGIAVIEDCTHALGATLDGAPVGTLSDASFFSFEQTKVVSAGAGGVAFSRDIELVRRIASFQSRCVATHSTYARRMMGHLAYYVILGDPRWSTRFPHAHYYLHRLKLIAGPETTEAEMLCEKPPGFERRWSGAQARVGLNQLARLEQNLTQRRAIADLYASSLAGSQVGVYAPLPGAVPAFVRYPIRVRDKGGLSSEMRLAGIQLGLWFTAPVHPAGVPQDRAGYQAGSCPNAEAAVVEVANLPCHPRMILADAERVVEVLLKSAHA